MLFADLQRHLRASEVGGPPHLVPLLELSHRVGVLLGAHKSYLEQSIDQKASAAIIARELGEITRCVVAVAESGNLDLDSVARINLKKIAGRIDNGAFPIEFLRNPISIDQYQRIARLTDLDSTDGIDPLSLGVPMLGIAGEAGSLLLAQKKLYRDGALLATDDMFIAEELGDILWYVSTVASHCELSLVDLMEIAIARESARRENFAALNTLDVRSLPLFDATFPPQERFPRRLTVRFKQLKGYGGPARSLMILTAAEPYEFFDSGTRMDASGKPCGFELGSPLGDSLTDNSRRSDGYRFHDAIHLGFLAVTGWSPVIRSLLRLKRRSNSSVDENEDGARAIFAEEGMAAVLARRSVGRQGFLTERSVDEDTVEMLTAVFADLEVSAVPPWLWQRAVAMGFRAMSALDQAGGGFLRLDLDDRTLEYARL